MPLLPLYILEDHPINKSQVYSLNECLTISTGGDVLNSIIDVSVSGFITLALCAFVPGVRSSCYGGITLKVTGHNSAKHM